MKFICPQNSLIHSVNIASKSISPRTTIPILKGLLLSLKGNELTLTGSCLDLSIETKMEVQGLEDGKIIVDAKLFSESLKKLPNAPVTIFSDEDGNLKLQCIGSKFSFICFSAEEFPATNNVDLVKSFTVNKKDFCNAIKKTSFAACTDEKRGILVGSLIHFMQGEIEIVALDGFRMSIARFPLKDNEIEAKIVVHSRLLSDIGKLLNENDDWEEILFTIDEKNLMLSCKDTTIIVRLLVGNYLNYEGILPKYCNTKLTIEKSELLSSIERALLFSKEGENRLIRFEILENQLTVSSKSEEGNFQDNLPCEVEGTSLTIGFNAHYILDILKSIEEENVCLHLIDNNSCGLFKPQEGDAYTFFVLPIRTVN